MDHAQAVLAGKEEPTVEDFIEWQEELSSRMAETGFTMGSWDPDRVFNFWTDLVENTTGTDEIEVRDDFNNNFEPEPSLEEVLEQSQGEITQMQQRLEMMQTNGALFSKTRLEVQRRLLQAGKTAEDIEQYNQDRTPLRHQISHLRQLEHPTPSKRTDGVVVWLILGTKAEQRKRINLPIKASLDEVCTLLEGIRKSALMVSGDFPSTPPAEQEKPAWKYILMKMLPLKAVSGLIELGCDADYRKMIRDMIKSGTVPFIREVMFHQSALFPVS